MTYTFSAVVAEVDVGRRHRSLSRRSYWDGLVAGATVVEELAPSAWGPGFGMLTDRFGVTWVLDVAPTAG